MSKLLFLSFLNMLLLYTTDANLYQMERGSTIKLQCPNTNDDVANPGMNMIIGRPGKMGPQGPPGPPGIKEPDSVLRRKYEGRISELETKLSNLNAIGKLGSHSNPATSCLQIRQTNSASSNGIYYLVDSEQNVFSTYCDMTTDSGGWTLIASIHENNMNGRCTAGDRWSSEQGNSAEHPHGDGFWENRAIHGSASSSSSDDYKSVGYFTMKAEDIMIWHVPNDTPIAFLKYFTRSKFLTTYGGNLQTLYTGYFPMRSKTYRTNTDNGPAIPVYWARGSGDKLAAFLPSNAQAETDSGYIQFRAINKERNAFALCPGVRIKRGKFNVEHVCIGSTSYNMGGHGGEERYCGDYAAKDWPKWTSSDKLIKSVVMIFYR
ncbi:intelectin-1-like [Styela clava]